MYLSYLRTLFDVKGCTFGKLLLKSQSLKFEKLSSTAPFPNVALKTNACLPNVNRLYLVEVRAALLLSNLTSSFNELSNKQLPYCSEHQKSIRIQKCAGVNVE